MALRFAVTARPVLTGFAPGATVTVNSVELPACTDPEDPVPVGLVGAPHELIGDAEFRGLGAPDAKSAPLLSLSLQPLAARRPAVVFVSVGAGDVSKQLGWLPPVP